MIDERRLAALSIGNTQSRKLEDVLGKMSEDDLWELRELIDSCLPSAELAQMNLTKELTIQYRRVLRLQELRRFVIAVIRGYEDFSNNLINHLPKS